MQLCISPEMASLTLAAHLFVQWAKKAGRLGVRQVVLLAEEFVARVGLIGRRADLLYGVGNLQDGESVTRQTLCHRFFFCATDRKDILTTLRSLSPQYERLVIQEADRICAHVFDLLGSGPTFLGDKIDWHVDFKTGHRWNPRTYYKRIRPAPYPGGYDIKVPWELSRCQHFVRLGQAYWITGDEKYAREFVAQVKDWIASNPWPWGVNWACTMDVAIRAVNWLWGYSFFKDSPSLTDDFLVVFYESLLMHGRHIYRNLENWGGFANNHYLADLVGLIHLGVLCPEFKEASEWRDFGLRELWKEMFVQVYPDGVSFEASIPYHRLVTEFFLYTIILCRRNDIPVPDEAMARLEKMLEFVMYYTKPDGTVPFIGDGDNGRLVRLKAWDSPEREWIDHRYLLAIGAVLFDRKDFAQAAGDQWEEVVWLLGHEAERYFQETNARASLPICLESRAFSDGGIFVIRDDGLHLTVDAGWNGQNGHGGHAHNDVLSYELFVHRQTWIIDPGTYIYTGDYEARQNFRSTVAHNTIQVDDEEQNRCKASEPFSIINDACPVILRWCVSDATVILVAEHYGYKRLQPPVVHRREFCLDIATRQLTICDYISGTGQHKLNARWLFPSTLDTQISSFGVILQDDQGNDMVIRWKGQADATLVKSWASLSYGLLVGIKSLSLTKSSFDCDMSDSPVFEVRLDY